MTSSAPSRFTDPQLESLLACPLCRGALEVHSGSAKDLLGASHPERDAAQSGVNPGTDALTEGLLCRACQRVYPVLDGIPRLIGD